MANLSRRFSTGASSLLRIFSAKPRARNAPPPPPPKPRPTPTPPPSLDEKVGLYRRLSVVGCTEGEVASAIEEYRKEVKTVRKSELEKCIKDFRRYKRYHHALEIGKWMQSQKMIFKSKDHAVHLHVIAKVKGIAAAEDYFNALPSSKRELSTYGALLHCYCKEKMSDKALDLFRKLVEEKMITSPLPFNHLMMMYTNLGQPEKVICLGEEIKKANIQPDTATYNLLMSGYSLLNDLEGVERVFGEMKAEDSKLCNWTAYSHLVNIYLRAKDQVKAKLALQDLEKVMRLHERAAYHFLISLYARMSDADNVRRVWKSLKSGKVTWNNSYLVMFRSLDNLDDMEGMKELFEEWERVTSGYDVRLPCTVIGAYLRRDMLEEAESVLKSALEKSNGPFFHAWELFMIFHLKTHDVKQAMELMEMAVSKGPGNKWKPQRETIVKFLGCFEAESDVSSAEEFYELMKRLNRVDSRLYESLLRTYVAAGRKLPDAHTRIERDGVEISSELEDLIASVSE